MAPQTTPPPDPAAAQRALSEAIARTEALGRSIEGDLDDIAKEIEDLKRAVADSRLGSRVANATGES